jgi:CDP-diacylglycerol--serine O-phosphatidyltransferase
MSASDPPSSVSAPPSRDPHRDLAALRRRLRRRRLAARKGLAILPTLLTLGNLLCGFAAIFLASRNPATPMPWQWTPITFAAIFIFLGMVFDMLDGRVARLTRTASDLGEQLDSMADMVTFGVAPAFIAVELVGVQTPFLSERGDWLFDRSAVMIAGLYVVCAALRLARFNIEVQSAQLHDHLSFKGLPTPGAAGTVAALVLLHQHFFKVYAQKLAENPDQPLPWAMWISSFVMVGIMFLTALAMTSALPYAHVMNRYVRGRAGFATIAAVVGAALLLAIYPQAALAGVFVLYALSAPVTALIRRRRKRAVAVLNPPTPDSSPTGK